MPQGKASGPQRRRGSLTRKIKMTEENGKMVVFLGGEKEY